MDEKTNKKTGETSYKFNASKSQSRLAKAIMSNNDFLFIKRAKVLYCWNALYYEGDILEELATYIEDCYDGAELNYKNTVADEIIERIGNRNAIKGTETNKNDGLIPFLNGYYDIKNNEMRVACSYYNCLYCIPHDYDPTKESKIFKPALAQIIPNDHDRDRLLIFMAYCLTNSVKYQKALMLYGRGNNGKSIICTAMLLILGDDLYSTIPLQFLGNQFNTSCYMGMLANIADDIPKTGLKDVSFFKMLAGSARLPGEIKGSQPFKYKNTCKSFNTCNMIPEAPEDATDGFWRKWEIIPLTQRFDDDLGNRDFNLFDKIETEEEIQGILSYIMSYLPRLPELSPYHVEENQTKWKQYGDSASVFHYQCLSVPTRSWITPSKLYSLYKKWCDHYSLVLLSKEVLGKRLAKFGVSKSKRTSKRDMDEMGKFVGDAKQYMVYEEIYPVFIGEEEAAFGIYKNEDGFYREMTEEEKDVQHNIDNMPDEVEKSFATHQQETPLLSPRQLKALILDTFTTFQSEEPAEAVTVEDILDVIATTAGITQELIETSMMDWTKDGTIYEVTNGKYRIGSKPKKSIIPPKKPTDWVDTYKSKPVYQPPKDRKPLVDATSKFFKGDV